MPAQKEFQLAFMTLILIVVLARYVRPGLDGILQKHMLLPSPFSWQWRKRYELRDKVAQMIGIVLLLFCAGFIYGYILFVYYEFVLGSSPR